MKRHTASALIAASCFAAAYVLGGSGASTEIITSAPLTVNVGPAHFMEIDNFTQVGGTGQRGTVVAGIFATPTPTATPVPTPTPTLSTNAGPGVALTTGGNLTDTATLFGNNPAGTIAFTLRDPTNVIVYTDTVTVNANGMYDTSAGTNPGGFMPSATGTYTWSAFYSGDTNNNAATDNGQNETEIVTSTPTPAPTPTPTPTPIVGTVLTATIIDSGGPQEPIKPIIIQGPAQITVVPVPSATLSITYRKFAESTPSPTATPTVAAVSSSTSTSTSTTGAVTAGAVTIIEAAPFDDDADSSTPTPTPTTLEPVATSTPTPTSTPTATPSISPIPSPSP